MNETYTRKQVEAWGNYNMVIGAIAITATHTIVLLLGLPSLDLLWQGVLLLVLVSVGYLYRKRYLNERRKRKKEEEFEDMGEIDTE